MMKRPLIYVLVIFGLICFASHPAKADNDVEELKVQIKQLQSTIEILKLKVEDLENKQTAQSGQVAKIPEISENLKQLKEDKPKGFSVAGARVGGHLKLYLLDQSIGNRNDVKQSNNLSAGLSRFYLLTKN